MQAKQVKGEELAKFTNRAQNLLWLALKKENIPSTNGFIVFAVRADGKVAVWLDMDPTLHEYFESVIYQATSKLQGFYVQEGSVVFALKLSIDTPKWWEFWKQETPKQTLRAKPSPKEWQAVMMKLADPNDIEALTNAAWPEE